MPQGTKLGPILFLILVNDAAIEFENKWKYVDDLTVGEIVKRHQPPTLQNSLDNVSQWCLRNDVLPKPTKCNLMSVCFLRNMNPPTDFTLNDVQLNIVSHLKLLGVTIRMIWSGTCTWKTLCPKPLENYTLSAFWRSVKPPLRTWWQYSVATSDQYLSMHVQFGILHWRGLKLTKLNCTKESPSDHLG